MLFGGHKRRGNFAQFLHLIGGGRKPPGRFRGGPAARPPASHGRNWRATRRSSGPLINRRLTFFLRQIWPFSRPRGLTSAQKSARQLKIMRPKNVPHEPPGPRPEIIPLTPHPSYPFRPGSASVQ